MKPLMRIFIPTFTIILLSACSPNSDAENATNDNKLPAVEVESDATQDPTAHESNQTNPEMTQAEVIEAIKTDLKTNLTKLLPSELPLQNEKYLTATTTSDESHYEVVFYESNEPTAINHETSADGQIIARLHAQKYESKQEADEQIAFENFSELGGQPIDLGYGITGYQDAGAGSMWTSWNEGRWAIATHTRTTDGEKGEELAKEATEFLETHTLPIPKPNGFAHIDVYQSNNRIAWQNENVVYMLDEVKDPMIALEIVTSIE
ncbi:hypothetical protein [Psychrobacillus lasiicapitis]|uniref:Lipoprotein n=1 Tax=Psychrobacillus lasiicapitis TaxID=1636719 RepID=A0A544SWP2_9BACI|nr:hypothetical protein [Psychrobacillus lasiicapitis]TQR09616.1 hypothetical protein FG382_19750 [Psychrobacillus lasiicapitis]GGA28990.1 hypothetical protein GCM10011384_18080 [Psychrobacillus lasiicapitis]